MNSYFTLFLRRLINTTILVYSRPRQFSRNFANLLLPGAEMDFKAKTVFEDLKEEETMALTRFSLILSTEFCKWINCDLKDEEVLQGREEFSLAFARKSWPWR